MDGTVTFVSPIYSIVRPHSKVHRPVVEGYVRGVWYWCPVVMSTGVPRPLHSVCNILQVIHVCV